MIVAEVEEIAVSNPVQVNDGNPGGKVWIVKDIITKDGVKFAVMGRTGEKDETYPVASLRRYYPSSKPATLQVV